MTSQEIIKQIADTEKKLHKHKTKAANYKKKLFRLIDRKMALDALSGKRGLA